jgi:YfiH family protein
MEFKKFKKISKLKYGVSVKSDGAMELAGGDLAFADNRRKFFLKRGINLKETVTPKLTHSASVLRVDDKNRGEIISATDGLVTSALGLFLTVTVADCFPVYFYQQGSKTIGLVHSGWRGTVKNIAGQAVKAIAGDPKSIIVGIGPGIQCCHFEIKNDILEKFSEYPEAIRKQDSKIFVDLPKIISKQLIASGLNIKNIESCGACTFCENEKYFSFRRDKPKNIEAMIAYIGLISDVEREKVNC